MVFCCSAVCRRASVDWYEVAEPVGPIVGLGLLLSV